MDKRSDKECSYIKGNKFAIVMPHTQSWNIHEYPIKRGLDDPSKLKVHLEENNEKYPMFERRLIIPKQRESRSSLDSSIEARSSSRSRSNSSGEKNAYPSASWKREYSHSPLKGSTSKEWYKASKDLPEERNIESLTEQQNKNYKKDYRVRNNENRYSVSNNARDKYDFPRRDHESSKHRYYKEKSPEQRSLRRHRNYSPSNRYDRKHRYKSSYSTERKRSQSHSYSRLSSRSHNEKRYLSSRRRSRSPNYESRRKSPYSKYLPDHKRVESKANRDLPPITGNGCDKCNSCEQKQESINKNRYAVYRQHSKLPDFKKCDTYCSEPNCECARQSHSPLQRDSNKHGTWNRSPLKNTYKHVESKEMDHHELALNFRNGYPSVPFNYNYNEVNRFWIPGMLPPRGIMPPCMPVPPPLVHPPYMMPRPFMPMLPPLRHHFKPRYPSTFNRPYKPTFTASTSNIRSIETVVHSTSSTIVNNPTELELTNVTVKESPIESKEEMVEDKPIETVLTNVTVKESPMES